MWEGSGKQITLVNRKKRKLSVETVRCIRQEWKTAAEPNRDLLGKKYGVSISTIDAIVRNKIWKHVA